MNDDAPPLAEVIGTRVREARLSHRWTLDQLADVAGTSRRSVINVEQGTANPSVGILLKLSDALGIGLPALVAPPERAALEITRSGVAAALWIGDFGGRGRLVAGTEPPNVVELWDWDMNPGDAHSSDAHVAGTRELIHVLEGAIIVRVGEESVALGTGDSLAFPGDVDHSYANEGDVSARFALTVHEPDVGLVRRGVAHA